MPCAIGIATVIVAAAFAAVIFFVGMNAACTASRPLIDGELLAPGWGYTLREADAVLTGRVSRKLGSQPLPPHWEDDESKLALTDYQIDVGRFWYPITASDRAIAVTVLEPNPEYGDGEKFVLLMHGADLAVGQRVLLFLGKIPPDRDAERAGELGLGYPLPEGFAYRNHYSVMGVFRYGVHCE